METRELETWTAEEDRHADARIADGERIARGSTIAIPGDAAIYHVTAVRHGGIYGHADTGCDPGGCAGHECYLGREDDEGVVCVSFP